MRANETARCPHCAVGVRFEATELAGYGRIDPIRILTKSGWCMTLTSAACPACGKPILTFTEQIDPKGKHRSLDLLAWPTSGCRPVPPEVEKEAPSLADDFREAVAVLPMSSKACAALARRCLQFILKSKGGAKKRDLADQIDEVLDKLPSELAANVDAIRHVGNFATHPIKSTSSGEILEAEDGEAEWLLDVLEGLFDHYYVAPAQANARRGALNAKLASAGKPPLKEPRITK